MNRAQINEKLLRACKAGHADTVRSSLKRGADVEARDRYGYYCTPLHYACEYGHSDVVRLLLEHGANMSLSDDNDWTPLDRACEQGFPNIVRLLLDHGADVNDWDEGGRTPLHVACLYGRSDVVRLLLEKGADVNAKSMTGWSALDYTLDLPPDEPSREEILDLFRQYAPEAVMEAYCTQTAGPGGM